jgi:putative salt-induced outer membrane protein YdiY
MPKRKRSNRVCWAALAVFVFTVFASQAADVIIHLKNGDRVTGSITAETATEVTVQSGVLGKVTIPVGQILRREEVVAKTAAPATNIVAKPTPPPGTNAPAPAAAALTKPKEPKRWNTELQLGLNLRYSAKDQQEALVIAKSTYGKDRFREILDYSFTYGQTEGVQSANRMNGSSKTEYDLNPKVYMFGLAGASYDEIRQIDRQFELNPGVGYHWLKKPDFIFKTEVGFGYQDQFFRSGREVETYSARLAGIVTWRIWNKLMEDAKVEYFPNIKSGEDYRLRLESTLRYPLLKNLSLNLIVIDLYDTQTPPNVQNNDLQVRSALGIKF